MTDASREEERRRECRSQGILVGRTAFGSTPKDEATPSPVLA